MPLKLKVDSKKETLSRFSALKETVKDWMKIVNKESSPNSATIEIMPGIVKYRLKNITVTGKRLPRNARLKVYLEMTLPMGGGLDMHKTITSDLSGNILCSFTPADDMMDWLTMYSWIAINAYVTKKIDPLHEKVLATKLITIATGA